jgi:hypothetical protein
MYSFIHVWLHYTILSNLLFHLVPSPLQEGSALDLDIGVEGQSLDGNAANRTSQ